MEPPRPNYHREFWSSPHHVALTLLTLGAGFVSAQLLGLIAGAVGYVLGWIYVPDFKLFRSWVDRRHNRARMAEEAARIADFNQRREHLIRSLVTARRERYHRLAQVCRDIERATAESALASAEASTDPRLRKLDELMWTYLRLLGIEESLERFLDTERKEDVPGLLREAEEEIAELTKETEALKAKGNARALETKQRYLSSRQERLEVLRKRSQRIQQAEENMALVAAEQDRLDQQIKLIRADAVATRNAETLTARIDATVEHLDQTNKWISELDEFKDLVGDMPSTGQRVGYEPPMTMAPAPPVVEGVKLQPPPLRGAQRQNAR